MVKARDRELKTKSIQPNEDQIHKSLVDYLKKIKHGGMDILFYHTPNGGSRNKAEASKLKRMGVLAGVSDLCIAQPTDKHHGLYLEVKRKGGRLSDNQKRFIQQANIRGYATAVCYSTDEGIQIINNYLNGEMV